MKTIVILVAILAVNLAESATLLKRAELSDALVRDPRYLLWENKEGLIQVEDLQRAETVRLTLVTLEDDVSFYIYTPENPTDGVQLWETELLDIVSLTGFNIERPTLVIIHGWMGNYTSEVNVLIKNAALASNDINVIVVDWSPIASWDYVTAQESVLDVGNFVGDFLLSLDSDLSYSISNITIAGHSLGAHVAGNAAARTGSLIPVVVGLDPAGPLFLPSITSNRLDPTDAVYVHVIHTNAGLLGYIGALGDADYYPNGGSLQPGCGVDVTGSCSHNRVVEYYAESVTNDSFVATLCDSYTEYTLNQCVNNVESNMGGYPVQQATTLGKYYLTTASESPYAEG